MRIALDGFPLSSPKTGIGHYTFELARTLAQISPEDSFELISPLPFSDSVIEEVQQLSLKNLILNYPEAASFRRRWWAIGLPFFLRQNSFDLFHGTNYEVPLWNRKRNVLTIHDLSLLLHPEYHEPHLVQRARRRLPLMLRSATRIIAVSESMKLEICEYLKLKPERVAVTQEAPRKTFRPASTSETTVTIERLGIEPDFMLTVGTIEPRKNLLTLARALDQILRRTSLRPQLVIAGGEGWLTDNLYSFIKSSGIGNLVRFIGYTSDEDLRALYSSCRVCVYPSFYEGFGLPPLEAMACGAPVITSRVPAIVETVGNAAFLVNPGSVEELAAAIIQLWNSPERRLQLSQAGLQRAADFSWEKTAKLTLGVYRDVLARKAPDSERGQATLPD
ncbi:MAG TPA: glycosyltransferase family 1 protein [Pyrinomonadaceae bacterium]|nr:glycosyltransferase family 1 protein [Pyrinomonadaceae bacterium]